MLNLLYNLKPDKFHSAVVGLSDLDFQVFLSHGFCSTTSLLSKIGSHLDFRWGYLTKIFSFTILNHFRRKQRCAFSAVNRRSNCNFGRFFIGKYNLFDLNFSIKIFHFKFLIQGFASAHLWGETARRDSDIGTFYQDVLSQKSQFSHSRHLIGRSKR